MPDQTPALRFQDLGHQYDEQHIVRDVDLEIQPGELVAILGASGSGKTTLLRAAAGFVTPTQGVVEVRGTPVASDGRRLVAPEDRGVGLMFQDYALFSHMTVEKNVGYGIVDAADRADRVRDLLAMVGLNDLNLRMPSELSGGQQQRVALARALATRPGLLLLDEPFANLDGLLRQEVGDEVASTLKREGIGGLMVTHDRGEALSLADRVAILGPGADGASRLLQCDTPTKVYREPTDTHVVALTGRASLLEATGLGKRAAWNGGEVTLRADADGPVTLVVRPEEATFRGQPEGNATVVNRRYRGRTWELQIHTTAGTILLDHNQPDVPEIGDRGAVQLLSAWPL